MPSPQPLASSLRSRRTAMILPIARLHRSPPISSCTGAPPRQSVRIRFSVLVQMNLPCAAVNTCHLCSLNQHSAQRVRPVSWNCNGWGRARSHSRRSIRARLTFFCLLRGSGDSPTGKRRTARRHRTREFSCRVCHHLAERAPTCVSLQPQQSCSRLVPRRVVLVRIAASGRASRATGRTTR